MLTREEDADAHALRRQSLNYADDAVKLAGTVGGKISGAAGDVATTVVGWLTW
nr:hypothetical protein [Streptomyces antibioticus]